MKGMLISPGANGSTTIKRYQRLKSMAAAKHSTFDDFMEFIHAHPEGFTVNQAAQSLGVSRQTVYNNLARARMVLGVALDADGGRYWLPQQYHKDLLRQFTLSTSEVAALVTAVEGIQILTPLARKALDKIKDRMEYTVRRDFESENTTYFYSQDQIADNLFDKLNRAIRTYRTVTLNYRPTQPDRQITQHRFDPLYILNWDRHFYLVGRSHAATWNERGGLLHLRLDRIDTCVLTRDSFVPPADFNPQAYIEASFGPFQSNGPATDVVLEFPAEKAKAAIGTIRHPSQQHELLADGRAIIRLHVPISDDLTWWIVSWPGIRVLAPKELREQVLQYAKQVWEANR